MDVSDGNGGPRIPLQTFIERVMQSEIKRLETCIDSAARISELHEQVDETRFKAVEQNANHRQEVIELLDAEIDRRFESAKERMFSELALRDKALQSLEKAQSNFDGRWLATFALVAVVSVGLAALIHFG